MERKYGRFLFYSTRFQEKQINQPWLATFRGNLLPLYMTICPPVHGSVVSASLGGVRNADPGLPYQLNLTLVKTPGKFTFTLKVKKHFQIQTSVSIITLPAAAYNGASLLRHHCFSLGLGSKISPKSALFYAVKKKSW